MNCKSKKCFKEIWQLLVSFIFLYIYSITFVKISSEKSMGISLFWFLNFFFWLFIRSFIQSNQEFHVADLTWPISCLFNFMGISSCVIPSSMMPVPRILEQLNSWRLNGRFRLISNTLLIGQYPRVTSPGDNLWAIHGQENPMSV